MARRSILALCAAVAVGGGTAAAARLTDWPTWTAYALLIGGLLFVSVVAVLPRLLDAETQAALKDRRERITSVQSYGLVDLEALRVPELVAPGTLVRKRLADIILSAGTLVALAPMLGIVALALKMERTTAPVLVGQPMIGRGGRVFLRWTFRTSDSERRQPRGALTTLEATGSEAEESPADSRGTPLQPSLFDTGRRHRTTRMGRVLERSSLHTLPMLFNVLRGDMTLVGPLPQIATSDVPRYATPERAVLTYLVPPGVTGAWWLVRGESVEPGVLDRLEAVYLANRSTLRDMQLILFGRMLNRPGLRRRALAILWTLHDQTLGSSSGAEPSGSEAAVV